MIDSLLDKNSFKVASLNSILELEHPWKKYQHKLELVCAKVLMLWLLLFSLTTISVITEELPVVESPGIQDRKQL